MDNRTDSLAETLGHRFARPELLSQSLTHSSVPRGNAGRHLSNQRLEFLGDRVLGLVVAQLLHQSFPEEDEGALALRYAALVRREALARVAVGIGLGRHIVMSQAEEEAGGRTNPSLLADACEAVIAALYLDGGLQTAADFIHLHWKPIMEEDPSPPQDPKTALQEWAQGNGLELPAYRETDRQGPPHAPVFSVEVSLEGLRAATATGSSKRAAEQAAAKVMLEQTES